MSSSSVVLGQVHERVSFIGKQPLIVFTLQDNGQVIAVVKLEWSEYPITIHSFIQQANFGANLFTEVAFDTVRCHAHTLLKKVPLHIGRELEATVGQHTVNGGLQVGVPLRRGMYMEIVERAAIWSSRR